MVVDGAVDEDPTIVVDVDGGTNDLAGPPYPGLPMSCQAFFNHGDGGCIDTWSVAHGPFTLQAAVEAAAALLDPADATIFDPDGKVPPAKRAAYGAAVAGKLDLMGLCAAWNGEELYVHAAAQDYSETFKLVAGNWFPAVAGHYQCTPASSIPGAPLPVPFPAQGCVPDFLPAGTTATMPCEQTGAAGLFFDDVTNAVLQVIAAEELKGASSLILDTSAHNLVFQAGWEDKAYRIRDLVFFLNAVAARLAPLGYCYWHGGYDTIILKKDLSRSEDFDLVQAVDCGGAGTPCAPTRPAGNYIRYPGKGAFCSRAEF